MNRNCGGWRSGCRLGALAFRLPFGLLTLGIAAGCGNGVKPPSGSITTADAGARKAGAAKPAIETLARFSEVAQASGVRFIFRDGQEAGNFAIIESLGGGVALFDYDADGTLDIFLPGGGRYGGHQEILGLPGALYRNGGDRTFLEVTRKTIARLKTELKTRTA